MAHIHFQCGEVLTVSVHVGAPLQCCILSCSCRTDPDFLIGYEVATLSWGYLVDRAAALDINLTKELSRMPSWLILCNTIPMSALVLCIPW